MSVNTSHHIPENTYKRRNRADSGTFALDDEAKVFCETMLRLADYLIEEDPMLDQPSQLTVRSFRKVYRTPQDTECIITKFLDEAQLTTSPSDPADAPGLACCVRLVSNNKPKTWDNYAKKIKDILLQRMNEAYTGEKFTVGKTIGGRWTVTSKLNGVKGTYNQGILFVHDNLHETMRIMKLLPSEAMYPGYPGREISILRRLSHPNIISLYDAHLPSAATERHATPYLVTEHCDKGTLAGLIKTWNQRGKLIPESFVWQVFESLVSAVQYLHHGPYPYNTAAFDWDPISHRDIISSNIFLTSSSQAESCDYPFSIKLADFGCAITDSEMAAHNYNVRDLPVVSADYRPPEEAHATEATDMYQIGLVISLMYCMMHRPSNHVTDAGYLNRDYLEGSIGYTSELRMYLEMCLDVDDDERPDSRSFLLRIQSARRLLSNAGKFGEQVELFASS
jgi:hypothetical protein